MLGNPTDIIDKPLRIINNQLEHDAILKENI